MNKAIVSACVAIGLVQSSPAAWGTTAEIVTDYGAPAVFNGQQARIFFNHNGPENITLGIEVPVALYDSAPQPRRIEQPQVPRCTGN